MQARVDQLVPYGYTDAAISTFHAFGDRLVREFALELGPAHGLARPVAARRSSSSCASGSSTSSWTSTGRSAIRPASSARWRRCSAAARTRTSARQAYLDFAAGLARAERPTARGPGAADAAGRGRTPLAPSEDARRQAELARPTTATRSCCARPASSTSATRSAWRCGLLRESPAARVGAAAPLPLHPGRRVPGHEPRPVGAGGAAGRAARQRHGRRRRRPVHLQVPRRGHQQHPGVQAAPPAVPPDRAAAQLPLAGAHPGRELSADPVQRPGPPGVPQRHRQAAASPSDGATERPVRHLAFATGSEEADRIAARDRGPDRGGRDGPGLRDPGPRQRRRGPGPAQPQPVPAFRGASRARPGLYARPEIRLLLAFLRAIADLSSSVDVYALAASDVYGLGGPDLTAIVNSARRRNRSLWEVIEELTRQPGLLRLAPRDPGDAGAARGGPAALHGAGPRAAGRRGPLPVPAGQRPAARGWRRRTRSRPRSRSRTSPGSSTSSGPSRTCCRTTGSSSSPGTSRR